MTEAPKRVYIDHGMNESKEQQKKRLVFLSGHLNQLINHMADPMQPYPVSPYRNPYRMVRMDMQEISFLLKTLIGLDINEPISQPRGLAIQPSSDGDAHG